MKATASARRLCRKSYLNMGSILSAAILSKAEAIHPGLRPSLRKNPKFASLCEQCHLGFIGAFGGNPEDGR